MRMEAASSCNAVSSKFRRGCLGFVSIWSSGMRRMPVAVSAIAGRSPPAGVFRSVSMFCNRERIPFPRASLSFLLGVVMVDGCWPRLFQDAFFLCHPGHIIFLQYFFGKVEIIHCSLAVSVV